LRVTEFADRQFNYCCYKM